MVFLDKYGWPVVVPKNRPVMKWLRRIIHTRRIRRGWWDGYRIVPTGQESPGPPACEDGCDQSS